MCLAQALVRSGELAPWRRARVAREVMAIERGAASDREGFAYAPLPRGRRGDGDRWSIARRRSPCDPDQC
jgi:hypothetical protein